MYGCVFIALSATQFFGISHNSQPAKDGTPKFANSRPRPTYPATTPARGRKPAGRATAASAC